MTKLLPIRPIYMAVLVILAAYFIVTKAWWLAGLLVYFLYQVYRRYSQQVLIKVAGGLLLFLLFFGVYHHHTMEQSRLAPRVVSRVSLIPDSIDVDGDLLSAKAKDNRQTYQIYYYLKTPKEKAFYQTLTKTVVLDIEAEVSKPEAQRNFKGFNYRSYLHFQGIYRIVSIDRIDKIRLKQTLTLWERLHQLRRKALVYCQQSFPNPMRHYMTGLLFGELSSDFDDRRQIYTNLGLIHLFALSGMQVGFFIGCFRYLLLRLGLRQDWVDILQVFLSVLYAAMTGYAVSVLRSLIQSMLGRLGIKKMDNLAWTILLMFIFQPFYLLTVGGVLTFWYAFLLALIPFKPYPSLKEQLWQGCQLFLGSMPLLIYFFSTVQPLSILLTLIFSYLFDGLILPVLVAAFALGKLLPLDLLNGLFLILEGSIRWGDKLIGPSLILGKPMIGQLVLCLILLGIIVESRRLSHRFWLLVLLAGLFCWIKHPLTNEVTMVDVGQGDSILIRDSWGKTILIDTGGKVSFGEKKDWQRRHESSNAQKTLLPYLKSRGIGQIDQLVLTHTDTDHVGDMEALSKEIRVKEILVSKGSYAQKDFSRRLEKLDTPVRLVKPGMRLPIMGSYLEVLAPESVGDGGNDDSIVLFGKLLGTRFLFTGDLEQSGEESLMARYPQLEADVLKVAHHGSKGASSTTFLKQVNPKLSLISVGRHNRYKHPNQETLDRLKRQDVLVYRTDQSGAIRLIGYRKWHLETVSAS